MALVARVGPWEYFVDPNVTWYYSGLKSSVKTPGGPISITEQGMQAETAIPFRKIASARSLFLATSEGLLRRRDLAIQVSTCIRKIGVKQVGMSVSSAIS